VLDHRKFFLCSCKFYASGAGRPGTLCASAVFLSTQTPTTKGHDKDS
jgi:hypothetical protein